MLGIITTLSRGSTGTEYSMKITGNDSMVGKPVSVTWYATYDSTECSSVGERPLVNAACKAISTSASCTTNVYTFRKWAQVSLFDTCKFLKNIFWQNFSTVCCTESYLPLSLHRRDVARSLGIHSVREPQRDLGTGQNSQHCNVTAKMWPSRRLIPKKNYFKLGHGILHGPVCQNCRLFFFWRWRFQWSSICRALCNRKKKYFKKVWSN